MPRIDAVELCRRYLFADKSEFEDKLSKADTDKILRCRAMYQWFIEMPNAKDAQFVQECCSRFKVSRPTAYSDLAVIKTLLPELSKTAREFHRWRYNEMILETYSTAKLKGDTRTMEKAATSYAKYNEVDNFKEEVDLADLMPQQFIPSMDPRLLGIEPIPDLKERQKKLLEKYSRETADIADVDFEEVDLADLSTDIAEKPLDFNS